LTHLTPERGSTRSAAYDIDQLLVLVLVLVLTMLGMLPASMTIPKT
jgi:hypothetical protein